MVGTPVCFLLIQKKKEEKKSREKLIFEILSTDLMWDNVL